MSQLRRENTLMKMKGAGDGIKNVSRLSERTPVPSSRKFTATLHKENEQVQLQLKKALDDMVAEQKGKLKRGKTVAEITPTKSVRKKPKRHDGGPSAVLHATPRPPAYDAPPPPSGRDDQKRRLELLVYHRMLVFVWRRSRSRASMQSESLRRQMDQISKLEKQVNCLKDLTQSECTKRGEAMSDCQRMESILQAAGAENNSLNAEKVALLNEVNDLRSKLESSTITMENMKNEMNTRNEYLRRLENEIRKERIVVQNIRNENAMLADKVKVRDVEIKATEEVVDRLNGSLKELRGYLEKCEQEKMARSLELQKLREQYHLKSKSYDCIRHELSRICAEKDEMRLKMDNLEQTVAMISWEYELTLRENEYLKKEQRCWWRNAKEFVSVSWALLQNAAYIMLPAARM